MEPQQDYGRAIYNVVIISSCRDPVDRSHNYIWDHGRAIYNVVIWDHGRAIYNVVIIL
jgi:hypothetical protein